MATSESLARSARSLVLVAAAALALLVAPSVSGTGDMAVAEPPAPGDTPPPVDLPTPSTPEEAQAQITQLNEQLEIVTEQFNQATTDLRTNQAAQQQAEQSLATLSGQFEAMQAKVGQMASSVYRSAPLSEFTSLMTSTSPDEFLAQMSGLDILGQRRAVAINRLAAAQAQADEAAIAAQQAAAATQATVDSLNDKKTWIQQQLAKQQDLLDSLTEDQREEVFGPSPGAGAWPDLPPPSGKAAVALEAARSKLGASYVWGAEGPSTFDCSGLTLWAWGQAGVSLPRTSSSQMGAGTPVPRSQLAPGDLVFFYSPVHHVGIYVGDGLMVHAPSPGDVVKISSIDTMPYTGARRVG